MYAHWVFKFKHSQHDKRATGKILVTVGNRILATFALAIAAIALTGCAVTVPKNVQVVQPFDVNRYLGEWYEIARLDHSFERDMIKVSATYTLNDDGSIKVVNRGFNVRSQEWDEAVGRAQLIQGPDSGALKVSFFGPFYGGYFITALDQENYQWAMVVGPDLDYFWILSRNRTLDPAVKDRLTEQAQAMGIPVHKIIWVKQ